VASNCVTFWIASTSITAYTKSEFNVGRKAPLGVKPILQRATADWGNFKGAQ